MRNAVLAVVALAVGTTAASGQTGSWADKLFSKGGTSHEFGSVPRGTQLFHRFTMYNIYAVPLEIINTRSSCGCVTITPSTTVLKPRETGYVDVMMDARRFTGSKTVSIFLTFGPQFTSTAVLTVSAVSRTDVVLNPGQLNFGVVVQGKTPTEGIDVEYAGVLDWRVTEVVKSNAPLKANLEEWYRRPGQVGYRLKVTLKDDAPAGPLKQELFLKTNDPASPLVPIHVEAMIQPTLSVAPATWNVGKVTTGEALTRRVVVRGNKPFRILKVEGEGDGLTVELPTSTGPVQVVTLKLQTPKAGRIKRELRFKTDLAEESTATVTIEGTVGP